MSLPIQDNRPLPPNRSRTLSDAPAKVLSKSKRVLDANVPLGMWSATAEKSSQAPTLVDIRQAKYKANLLEQQGTEEEPTSSGGRRFSRSTQSSGQIPDRSQDADSFAHPYTTVPAVPPHAGDKLSKVPTRGTARRLSEPALVLELTDSGRYPNGYKFPPKHTWTQSVKIGFSAYLRFLVTPFGFLITIYGLNVVAWGAMIFFLLIGAASQTMCTVQRPYNSGHYVHDCNDLYSPRRIWIEVDSQVLTALFCVTAFGLVPWRFRDLFYLLKWRLLHDHTALRRLGAWHRGWFRLPGSDCIDPFYKACAHDVRYNLEYLPEPAGKASDPPLTGIRATPTALWKMDFAVWCAATNTFMQVVLCYFMWHENRFVRPSWATGCFVALGCISAGVGGVVMFIEGRRIKRVEGIPLEVGQAVEKIVEEDSRSERINERVIDKV